MLLPKEDAGEPVPIPALPVVTIFWLPKLGAIFVPAIAASLLMSALTMSLTVRALLSLVGVTVSPLVNV